jgi:hypothetical protein
MRPLYRILAVSSLFLLVLNLSVPLSKATQILYQTPQQLGEQSSLVVRGKVTSTRSFWNDQRTKVFTETQIAVDETYKGGDVATLRVVQLGGVVDNIRVTVSGALQWIPGEEVLLFVEPYRADTYQVSGFSQGKFNVKRDPLTGKAFIQRPALEGVEIMGAPSADGMTKASKVEDVPLEVFVNQALGDSDKGGSR